MRMSDAEDLQHDIDQRADERPDRAADAADDGDDQDVDDGRQAGGAGRDLGVLPDQQDAGDGGDDGGEGVGGDAVGGDVEAERRHAARIVADALERQAEGRARDVGDGEEGERPRSRARDSRTGSACAS